VAEMAKSTTTPAYVNRSLIRSHRSDQVILIPLRKRATARFSKGSMVSTDPHKQPPNQSRPSQLACWP